MPERLGRMAGFTWFAVTTLVPWRLIPFIAPIDSALEEIPGFIRGEIKAMNLAARWKSRRTTRRISRQGW